MHTGDSVDLSVSRGAADPGGARVRRPTMGALWTSLAILLPVASALAVPLSAIDLGYAIRAGDLTMAQGSPVRTDPFTYTVGGEPWLNQQWLAQVLLALVHGAGGWVALGLVRAALVAGIVAFVVAAIRLAGVDRRTSALLVLAGFLVALPGFALRAQLVGAALFAGSLWILAQRDRRPAATWLLVPVAALWANVHGSFVLLPTLVGLTWLGDTLRRGRSGRRRPAWPLLGVALAAAAATLLNPFGVDAWSYAAGLTRDPRITGLVTEWQRTSPFTGPGLLFAASGLTVAALGVWGRRRVGLGDVLVLVPFALLGAWAERGILWWGLLAPVVVAPWLALPGASEPRSLDRRSPLNLAVPVLVVALGLVAFPGWRAWLAGSPEALVEDAPARLSRDLREGRPAGTRVFVHQPWASWVELDAPGYPVFVDSRFELFPADTWSDYERIVAGGGTALGLLDRWAVDAVLVPRASTLAATLAESATWESVAERDDGILYRRADAG